MPRTRRQPVREIPASVQGERQALSSIQQAAPLQEVEETPPIRLPTNGVFGPTDRPTEPITAGAPLGPGRSPSALPQNADLILQRMYRAFPHPAILRLIQGG